MRTRKGIAARKTRGRLFDRIHVNSKRAQRGGARGSTGVRTWSMVNYLHPQKIGLNSESTDRPQKRLAPGRQTYMTMAIPAATMPASAVIPAAADGGGLLPTSLPESSPSGYANERTTTSSSPAARAASKSAYRSSCPERFKAIRFKCTTSFPLPNHTTTYLGLALKRSQERVRVEA